MITCQLFDTLGGKQIYKYTLSDGITAEVVTCGATLVSLCVPNNSGTTTDILLGHTSARDIVSAPSYMGSVVGRCANRIAAGRFTLEGKNYQLATNNNCNHLHGGNCGFNQKIFDAKVVGNSLLLTYNSPDGEENYPANLQFTVKYTVSGTTLLIEYFAQSDGTTLFNPTSHAYFNLDGQDTGSIYGNVLQINAAYFLPVDDTLIPTGEQRSVLGGVFDFTSPKPIGRDIDKQDSQLVLGGGYDHNFCLDGTHAATAYSPQTGIVMDCFTDACGLQFYTGNFLDEKGKSEYRSRSGFCLETQFYPNAINVANWQQPIITKYKQLHYKTQFVFSVRG